MLGNDIIDLQSAKAQSNWRRKGYLAKIFNADEQIQILRSTNPDQLIWLFWSMKEAVYKIVNRKSLHRSYNPQKFTCRLNGNEGVVNFEKSIYYTKSFITEKLIHTVATAKKENLAHIRTYFLENKSDYLSNFNLKSSNYSLEKDDNGIPNLVDKSDGKKYFASISHHGKHLAIVHQNFTLSRTYN